MCFIGNRRPLIKHCPVLRPGKDTQASSKRTANTGRKSTDGKIPKVLLYGNWTLTRGNQGVLLFASRAMTHGHGLWERRRCRQRSLMLETWFTPSDEETDLPPGSSVHEGKKMTRQHCLTTSSHAFIAIKTVTPVWACTVIPDDASPSADEAWLWGRTSMLFRDWLMPHTTTQLLAKMFAIFNASVFWRNKTRL